MRDAGINMILEKFIYIYMLFLRYNNTGQHKDINDSILDYIK